MKWMMNAKRLIIKNEQKSYKMAEGEKCKKIEKLLAAGDIFTFYAVSVHFSAIFWNFLLTTRILFYFPNTAVIGPSVDLIIFNSINITVTHRKNTSIHQSF